MTSHSSPEWLHTCLRTVREFVSTEKHACFCLYMWRCVCLPGASAPKTPSAPKPKHAGFLTVSGRHQRLWPSPPSISAVCVWSHQIGSLIFYRSGFIVNSCRSTCQTTHSTFWPSLHPDNCGSDSGTETKKKKMVMRNKIKRERDTFLKIRRSFSSG